MADNVQELISSLPDDKIGKQNREKMVMNCVFFAW